jgi:hypothetical protein
MDIERIVEQLQEDISEMRVNVAVIRADLDNHVTTLASDLRCVKTDVRGVRDVVERMAGAMSKPERSNGWRATSLVVSGWAVGLLMLVLQYLLNSK